MALILDTNALSAYADGDPKLRKVIEREWSLAIPVVVLGEYLYGIQHSRHRAAYQAWLDEQLTGMDVLAIGPATAAHYAAIRSELKAKGKPIPTNDLWIAALARQHRGRIVSRDLHFSFVPGLRMLAW